MTTTDAEGRLEKVDSYPAKIKAALAKLRRPWFAGGTMGPKFVAADRLNANVAEFAAFSVATACAAQVTAITPMNTATNRLDACASL